jgi:uncharacterized Zn-binding protein involved in type VI secretion
MPPAARVGDMHTCPMVNPNGSPHTGGPVLPTGAATVLVQGAPCARAGDILTCAGPPDTIAGGSSSVLVGGMPAARMGDATAHGGVIVAGSASVLIGG